MAKAQDQTGSIDRGGAPPAAVIAPFGKRPLRTFALAIGLPAFLMYVLSAGLVIGALAIMAGDIDRLADQRGVTSMHAALDSFLNDLSNSVSDEGTWDEAYLNVVVSPDPAWMDTTWGTTARLGQSYDNVIVTDQIGEIIFGENNLGAIKGNISARYPAATKMLHELDKGIAATTDATTVSNFAADQDGTAGLAAISIHQSAPAQKTVSRQSRRILWIAKHLTPSLLQDIAVRYQTPLATLAPNAPADASSIGLADADGNGAGTVSWIPDRPGDVAFNRALLVAMLVFFGIGLLLVVGLGLLRRSMVRRAAEIEAAHVAVVEAVAAVATASPHQRRAEDREAQDEDTASPIEGVNAQDFVIEYQPVFDLRSETLVGVEALLRWTRPDKSPMLQEDLLPADRARLYERVGAIVVRHATGEVAPLLGLTLTVAVTPALLESSVFAEKVAGTLAATNFPARRLQLAVDTPLLPDLAHLRQTIADLHQTGVGIVLSEFSVTAATAAYLDSGLVSGVRLARDLVSPTGSGAAQDTYLAACIEAARAASLPVTVTGLEQKEQASRLLRLGCREFQGNLLARAMPVAALTQLVLAPARPSQARKAG